MAMLFYSQIFVDFVHFIMDDLNEVQHCPGPDHAPPCSLSPSLPTFLFVP